MFSEKNWFIVLLRTLFFFFSSVHGITCRGVELLQLGAGMPQNQWWIYGHHQITLAYKPRQTSVLCLFRKQWMVGHFLLLARSIFSLIFIPNKILNHEDCVMQKPLSLELLLTSLSVFKALLSDMINPCCPYGFFLLTNSRLPSVQFSSVQQSSIHFEACHSWLFS